MTRKVLTGTFLDHEKKLKTRKGHEKSFRIISVFSNGLLYASHSDRWFGINKNTNRTNNTNSINDNVNDNGNDNEKR
jgi:hypothetical protein